MCRSPFGTVGSPVHAFEMLSEIGYKTASLFDDVVPERIVASRSLARLFYSTENRHGYPDFALPLPAPAASRNLWRPESFLDIDAVSPANLQTKSHKSTVFLV